MTLSHKLVITLPDEATINAEEGTVTMGLEQAREWALSIIDATPTGITKRERVQALRRASAGLATSAEHLRQMHAWANSPWPGTHREEGEGANG